MLYEVVRVQKDVYEKLSGSLWGMAQTKIKTPSKNKHQETETLSFSNML